MFSDGHDQFDLWWSWVSDGSGVVGAMTAIELILP
jgi:hypothetical protein